MRARSVQTACPRCPCRARPTSGLAVAGQVVEDVAERDEVRREVRHLDADRLLARDRREDADLRRRERVREVVLQRRDLRDLRPGRELQLVARHARAGDLADDVRVDAEVRERLHERVGHPRAVPRPIRPWAASSGAGCRGRAACTPRRRRPARRRTGSAGRRERLGLRRTSGGGWRADGLGDDVREAVHGVDRAALRLGASIGGGSAASVGQPRPAGAVERAPRGGAGAAHGVPERRRSAPSDAPVSSSAPRPRSGDADDRRARRADQAARRALSSALADGAAVLAAERQQQAEREHGEAGPERADVDERAARRPSARRRRRAASGTHVGRGPERREAVGDPAADHAAVPAEVEDGARKTPARPARGPTSSGCWWPRALRACAS